MLPPPPRLLRPSSNRWSSRRASSAERKKKKKKKKDSDKSSESKSSSGKLSSSTTNNTAPLLGAGTGSNGNSGAVASPPPPAPPTPPTASGSGQSGGLDSGGLSDPAMQQQGHQPAQSTSQEDDPPEEIEAKIEGLIASYELLELGVDNGLETDDAKDRINDVTESWLELVSSGRISQDQILRIRSQCTLSLATTATGKRKGRSSTGTGGSSNGGRGRGSGGSGGGGSNKRRSKGSSTAGGGNKENGDGHDDEQEPVVYSPDEAKLTFKQAKEYLFEMIGKREEFLNGSDDGYDTPYLLVRLPSLMAQTHERISGYFENDYEQPIDQCIRIGISDHIDPLELGMNSAVSFLDTGDKAWIPVRFSSLGSLANDLEELCVPTVAESHTRLEVKSAVMHAKRSGQFDLPTNQSPKNLAKHFLTMNVATKSYLLTMVHCAAGCGMFNSLVIEDLTTGKDPIVSREFLMLLDYDEESAPEDTNDLLLSYRKAFDCFGIPESDKIKLMASFLRIRQEIQHLSDDRKSTGRPARLAVGQLLRTTVAISTPKPARPTPWLL